MYVYVNIVYRYVMICTYRSTHTHTLVNDIYAILRIYMYLRICIYIYRTNNNTHTHMYIYLSILHVYCMIKYDMHIPLHIKRKLSPSGSKILLKQWRCQPGASDLMKPR